MNKLTLLTTTLLLLFSLSFNSCDDADFEDTDSPVTDIVLNGTSWTILQQSIEIEPNKEFETTVEKLNAYYKKRLKEQNAIQEFDERNSITSYFSKETGDKLLFEESGYELQNDTITFIDPFFGKEIGSVKLIGSIITFKTQLAKEKLNGILIDANIDPNINDNLVKEIKYTVIAKKISK